MKSYLRVDQVQKLYKETKALDQLSFTISEGRCTGLLGANGAGKTTTLKILSGLIKPTHGKIFLNENPIDPQSISYRKRIGYLPQYPQFNEWMTGQEFLEFSAKLYDLPSANSKSRIDEVLEIVELSSARKKRIGGYSGGMKQRLGIAQAILHHPEFLIMDEPVSALDPEGRYQIVQLIQQLKKKSTILLSTHILHDADTICDDVVILHKGKKIIESNVDALKKAHQEPMFQVHFPHSIEAAYQSLQSLSWIDSIEKNEKTLFLRAKDKEKALSTLPIFLLEQGYIFDSYQMFEPTLEDIFLKLVKEQ